MAGERVPYHLRQNKHVERELFIELLAHVGIKTRLTEYLYVGFGGPFFEDFKALHSRLGIRNMLSLERDEWVYRRQKVNVPYGCVQCKQMDSAQFVQQVATIRAEFPKANKLLCWLDYASPNQLPTQLDEIRTLLPKLARHDIFKITFNANPATLGDLPVDQTMGVGVRERRLQFRRERLRMRLGHKFPGSVDDEDLTPNNYPGLLSQILKLQVSESMRENPELMFQPLGCFAYADSEHTMLTCTGILLRHTERDRFLSGTGLRKVEFASLDWQIYKIDIPYLSVREKFLLDQKIFDTEPRSLVEDHGLWVDKDAERSAGMINDYVRLYRFYPHFHRIYY